MSVSFDVEEFEQVSAGSGMALLRVAGRWRHAFGEVGFRLRNLTRRA
jgi:hypothetical protein